MKIVQRSENGAKTFISEVQETHFFLYPVPLSVVKSGQIVVRPDYRHKNKSKASFDIEYYFPNY